MKVTPVALVALATLTAMPAVGDFRLDSNGIWWPDNVLDHRHHSSDHIDRDDSRIDEVFPVKHRCSEVDVLIHAQRRTMERMIESCNALKWTADRFHALMQTNPHGAAAKVNVYGHATTVMEMFVLDWDDPEYESYFKEFWDSDSWGGRYFRGISLVSESSLASESEDGIHSLDVEVHEYVHHLQYSFDLLSWLLPTWIEGFATFLQIEFVHSVLRDGWYIPQDSFGYTDWRFIERQIVRPRLQDPPHLTTFLDRNSDQWQDLLSEYHDSGIVYYWGAWVFRFLAERHHTALLNLREMLEGQLTYDDATEALVRMHDLMARLNGDWYDWHESLATLSVADTTEPIIIHGREIVSVDLRYFFRTINMLAFDISPVNRLSTDDNPQDDDTPPAVHVIEKVMHLIPNSPSPGTWEFTITATDADGQSAELLFTAVVTARLEASEIVIQDPISTEEGQTVVNLGHYFSGPEDVAFTAGSANAEVATAVVVTDGMLVVTAIAPGEVEITVRATSGRQSAERTFTIVVTDECPPWLCKGPFSGWRKMLLQ